MASHGDLPPPQPGSINVPQPTPTKSIASPRVQSTGNPTMNTIETPDKSSPIGSASVDSRSQTQTPALPLFRKPESQRFAAGNAHPAKAAKIAIPRLKTASASAEEGEGRPSGRHRVNHACEPCRHRKTKCSGERPVCRHCQDFKIACYYADGKRDRVKKQFGSMTEKVADYEKLLKQIMTRVGENDADLIRSILDREDPVDMETQDRETSTLDGEVPSDGSGNESDVSAGAGSTGALDRTEEDFTRGDAKTTGFMGKNSEITWMQRLQQENRHGTPPLERADVELGDSTQKSKKRKSQQHSGATPKAHEDGFTVHASSYHLDDAPISTFEAVEAYELPTREVANHLFEAYISRVQPTFPIVSKNTLSLQFHKFMIGQLQRPPDKWLAILNLIFAIAAKYSHLIQADWRGDERDHLIYFTRARMLGLNGESVFEHVDLQHIQITGLMSFYLICTSQINRAWTLAGLAIRGATSLGMNMRNESSDLQNSYKEIRYRVWWSLYSLEHRLCSMTGRINCILEDHVTTPLPLPYEEDEFETEAAAKLLSLENQQSERNPAHSRSPSNIGSTPSTDRSRSLSKPDFSRTPSSQPSDLEWAKNVPPNSSLYFLHLIQLTRLTQGIFHKLYTPAAITGSWKDIQKMIGDLQIQLDEWYKDLPVAFDFKRKQRDRDFFEHRLSLGFFFYGTCITINRPTLCRLERKMPNQSKQSHEFNSAASAKCLEAAMEMLDLIPDEPNAIGLNRVGPFWSILHWLMQASTVLMLELSFRVYHMPQEAENILEAAQKSVRWIHSMGEENPSARRAWGFCNTMLRDAARKIGREITSLPTQPPGHASGSSESGSTKDSSKTFQQLHAPPIVYSSAPSMPNFHEVYANFDPLMHHDQYYPIETTMEEALSYGQATTAEMEFMSHAYHDSQAHQQVGTQQGGHSGPRYD